ncbi:MAG: hypothetical protein KDJ52_26755, partial [Anaerolineae bacterium]|nr:hypothetical protein [Anaerolineae bacterium]
AFFFGETKNAWYSTALISLFFGHGIVLFDLCHDDVLINPDKKKDLMLRLDYIASRTLMLASRYSSRNERNQDWANRHFKEMELYVRERERWIIAPVASTLENLRSDFYEISQIYIIGNYGDFSWQDLYVATDIITFRWYQRLIKGIPRLVGIMLPLLLMGLYLWQPGLFPAIQIDANVVTLLFMAWLLLAIDATLNLGIVTGLANLAKGLKDLA